MLDRCVGDPIMYEIIWWDSRRRWVLLILTSI